MDKYYTPSIEEMRTLKQITMLSEETILKYFKEQPHLHKDQIINLIIEENEPRKRILHS